MFSLYNVLGIAMFIWYSSIRWTMFTDHKIYWWAYEPVNLFTAFLSILFLTFAFTDLIKFFSKNVRILLFGVAFLLCYRSCYYTIEDILDFTTSPLLQMFYIIIDVAMGGYTYLYLCKNRDDIFGG